MRDPVVLIGYLILAIARVATARSFWRMATFKGDNYFFDTVVPADFYQGAGKEPLWRYRRSILILAVTIEALCLADFLWFNRYSHIVLVQIPISLVGAVLRVRILRLHSMRAKSFESEGDQQAPPFVLSLKQRRLADYTNPGFEIVLAIVMVGSMAALIHYYRGLPDRFPAQWSLPNGEPGWEEKSFSRVFLMPILLLYLQPGYLMFKHAVIHRKMMIPATGSDEYIKWREDALRQVTRALDFARGMFVFCLAAYAYTRAFSPAWLGRIDNPGLVWAVGMAILLMAFLYRYSRGVDKLRRRAKSVAWLKPRRPAPDPQRFFCAGLFYYDRENPALLIAGGPRWFAFNLANKRAYLYATYASGIVMLGIWLARVQLMKE